MPLVNGCDVPVTIPRDLILIYFPRGILGLRELPVDDSTPGRTVLPDSDGTLRLEEGRSYHLFSAPIASMDAAHGHCSEGIPVRSYSATMDGGLTSSMEIDQTNRAASSCDDHGGNAGLVVTTLAKLPMFQAVSELHPPDGATYDPNDIEARERYDTWHRVRKGQMWHYFLITSFSLIVLMVVLIIDGWLSCECASLGLWQTCANCIESQTEGLEPVDPITPAPMTLPVGAASDIALVSQDGQSSSRDASRMRRDITDEQNRTWVEVTNKAFRKCVPTESFSMCENPSFSSLQVMLVVVIVGLGINFIVVSIDIGLNMTPRRPFYAFIFITVWAVWMALWLIFCDAALTAVQDSMSKIECAMQLSLQAAVRSQWSGDILIYTSNATQSISYRATVKQCRFSWSFWLATVGCGCWTIFGGGYFYRRYSTWRQWGSTTNTIKSLLGLQGIATPEHDGHIHSRRGSRQERLGTHVPSLVNDGSAGSFSRCGSANRLGPRTFSSSSVPGSARPAHHRPVSGDARVAVPPSFSDRPARAKSGHSRINSVDSVFSAASVSQGADMEPRRGGITLSEQLTSGCVSLGNVGIELVSQALRSGSSSASRGTTPANNSAGGLKNGPRARESPAHIAVLRYGQNGDRNGAAVGPSGIGDDADDELFDAQSDLDF